MIFFIQKQGLSPKSLALFTSENCLLLSTIVLTVFRLFRAFSHSSISEEKSLSAATSKATHQTINQPLADQTDPLQRPYTSNMSQSSEHSMDAQIATESKESSQDSQTTKPTLSVGQTQLDNATEYKESSKDAETTNHTLSVGQTQLDIASNMTDATNQNIETAESVPPRSTKEPTKANQNNIDSLEQSQDDQTVKTVDSHTQHASAEPSEIADKGPSLSTTEQTNTNDTTTLSKDHSDDKHKDNGNTDDNNEHAPKRAPHMDPSVEIQDTEHDASTKTSEVDIDKDSFMNQNESNRDLSDTDSTHPKSIPTTPSTQRLGLQLDSDASQTTFTSVEEQKLQCLSKYSMQFQELLAIIPGMSPEEIIAYNWSRFSNDDCKVEMVCVAVDCIHIIFMYRP